VSTRILSGLIGGGIVVAVLMFNQNVPILLNLLVAVVCLLSSYEFFCAINIKNFYFLSISSLLFTILVPIFANESLCQIFWYIYTIITFLIMIFNKNIKFKDVLVSYSITVMISFALSSLIFLRNIGGKIGSFYVLTALGIAWFSDTGAYFGGSFFGRQKLCPDISPKKTVEGVISGAVSSVIIMALLGIALENKLFSGISAGINYIPYMITCLIGSFIAVLGDLCFSLLKRGLNIKDFGNVLPGHGGILDRFDSVIFVAPFVYFILKFIPILKCLD